MKVSIYEVTHWFSSYPGNILNVEIFLTTRKNLRNWNISRFPAFQYSRRNSYLSTYAVDWFSL